MADIEYKTPQDVAAEKATKAAGKAYEKSLTTTEVAPAPKKTASEPVKKMAKGGSVSSASKRADGCATKGKTKGTMIRMG